MRPVTVTWRCPVCGGIEIQPKTVRSISHACPRKGGRLVILEPEQK